MMKYRLWLLITVISMMNQAVAYPPSEDKNKKEAEKAQQLVPLKTQAASQQKTTEQDRKGEKKAVQRQYSGRTAGAEKAKYEPAKEAPFLANIVQIISDGKRSGEGYFSADSQQLIYQSEEVGANPFYQIYVRDLASGKTSKVSPGIGKTSCAWIHPNGRLALFSSTHDDPNAINKQQQELAIRAEGKRRRYSWSFDEHYDIYTANLDGSGLARLTRSPGYDAEGSYSPNGDWIAFASNRSAYNTTLSDQEKQLFERDASYFMDIYLMRSDGSGLKRLTRSPGYDGGPFFSPDGQRIIWRRFAPDGRTAEVWTMDLNGNDQRQLTRLSAMSWAPYYHPSGDYAIFATSVHGHRNFELYLVDIEGEKTPVRVTFSPGFDGLPVFSPDGKHLAWSSARTKDGSSQIFMADWNDKQARAALGL